MTLYQLITQAIAEARRCGTPHVFGEEAAAVIRALRERPGVLAELQEPEQQKAD